VGWNWNAKAVDARLTRRPILLKSLLAAQVALVTLAAPAFADGGKGGDSPSAAGLGGGATGGAGGGDGTAGQTGGNGIFVTNNAGAGGGGGGAGGGAGASGGNGSLGGAGGGSTGLDGASESLGGAGAGGGGGGNGGANGQLTAGGITVTSAVSGSEGGTGGNGGNTMGNLAEGGGGGGGGAGGYGLIVTGSTSNTNNNTITAGNGGVGGRGGDATGGTIPNESDGGNGGSGGDGSAGARLTASGAGLTNSGTVQGGDGGTGGRGGEASGTGFPTPGLGGTGGNGGAGGAGVTFTGGSGTLTNNATIQGGNGGIAGAGGTGVSGGAVDGSAGNVGQGGVGVTGAGLTIINNGTIFGGVSGDGVTHADAIVFTGGTNFLGGTGTVGSFTMTSGGTFAPGSGVAGTFMTVSGNLAFQSAAIYLIQVSPSAASYATVTGTATLAGAVQATFASGGYTTKSYDILHAAVGITGTFSSFSGNVPAGFSERLSYTSTDVFLNLVGTLGAGAGLNTNQQNVASALNTFFNNGGALPPGFVTLFGLTGSSLGNALTQASGETATGSQQTTFDAMNQFMGLLTDPFIDGRGDGVSTGGSAATGYASTQKTGAARDANAMFTKAMPSAPSFEQRWSVWTAGYGGSQTTDGNAALGSNSTTSSIAGTAVGADYRFSPFTIAGFALAGGGTSFSVANGGSGRSDLFQAGAFVRHNVGPAYISAALAYGWQDVTTNRTVTVAGTDMLRAEFNANAFSGRIEGGYRFVSPWIGGVGITPYAAGQFTTFDLPAYAESVLSGAGNFALAYNAKSVTDTRSELGIRTDKSWALTDSILTLRGRVAWAHDYNPDRSIAATFQTLPGASFVVNGAAQAQDSALTTASAEFKWINGWSAAATFEGEFSEVTASYAGKGVVRYAW
jgi:uncharacterized protein with beta-barrel porin domain